jgi:hypothetical protein
VTQEVSYVQGDLYFRVLWRVENRGESQVVLDLFHAADIYFSDRDEGYGYYNPATGAVGGYSVARDAFMSFSPQVPATNYQEAQFMVIWNAIGRCDGGTCQQGPGFNNSISDIDEDNGIGLQWRRTLAPGQGAVLSDLWGFGPTPPETPVPSPTATELPEPTATPTDPPQADTPTPRPSPTDPPVQPTPPPEIPEAGSLVLLASGLASLAGYVGIRGAGRKRRDRS